MVGLKIAMVFFVALADMSGGRPAAVPDPAPVVWEQPTAAPTEAPKVEVQTRPPAEGFRVYTIHGQTPPIEWQRHLYNKLAERGYSWYMPYAVCQIWQESCWNQYSTNGIDSGLTQQKEAYWEARSAHWGVPGASIWDVYAQLHVYACMMCHYLDVYGGNVEMALSLYFYGTGDYAPEYVGYVMSHMDALEVVR